MTIVDYGLGNVQAFVEIYRRLNIPVSVAQTREELASAQKIILPGVGAFDWAMERLNASGMRDVLDHLVMEDGHPVLGVCVGMQMMARRSDEGELPGLGWIPGEVKHFGDASLSRKIQLPHMGWNDAVPRKGDCLFNGITNPRYYFLHSYYFIPDCEADIIATTNYMENFTSAVRSRNIFGTQFHPEKSHKWGIQLLKNFAEV